METQDGNPSYHVVVAKDPAPTYPAELDQLTGGVLRAKALELFRACCNHRHTLFVTDKWLRPYWEVMAASLGDPIRDDEADGLKAALRQEVRLEIVAEWLRDPDRLPWHEHLAELALQREQARLEGMKLGYFPRDHVEVCRNRERQSALTEACSGAPAYYIPNPHQSQETYMPKAQPCPLCGAGPGKLTWIYFVSPEWTWRELCGRAGWLTVCDPCHAQIDLFCEVMN